MKALVNASCQASIPKVCQQQYDLNPPFSCVRYLSPSPLSVISLAFSNTMALSTLLAALVTAVLSRLHSKYRATPDELALANLGDDEDGGGDVPTEKAGGSILDQGQDCDEDRYYREPEQDLHALMTPYTSAQRAKPCGSSYSESSCSHVVPINTPDAPLETATLPAGHPSQHQYQNQNQDQIEPQPRALVAAVDAAVSAALAPYAAKTDAGLADIRNALSEIRVALAGHVDRLDRGLQAVRSQGGELSRQLEATGAQQQAMRERLEQTSSDLVALRDNVATLNSTVKTAGAVGPSDSHDSRSSAASQEPATSSASSVSASDSASKADLSALCGRLESTRSEMFALVSSLHETKAAVADTAKTLLDVSGHISALREGVDGSHAEIAALRKDLAGPFHDDSEW